MNVVKRMAELRRQIHTKLMTIQKRRRITINKGSISQAVGYVDLILTLVSGVRLV